MFALSLDGLKNSQKSLSTMLRLRLSGDTLDLYVLSGIGEGANWSSRVDV